MSKHQDNWVFAYQGAKRVVFEGADLYDLIREDLFSETEWKEEVNLWMPRLQAWKDFLAKQSYQVGDYVICAARILRPHVTNRNQLPLEQWEIENIENKATYPTVSFLGQIKSFYPDRPGYFGKWASFRTFHGEGDCQRRLDDLLIISEEQKEKALQGNLTCDELKLPEIKFNYETLMG